MNYKQETINPYHEGEKTTQVEQMFDNIAPTYDTLNHRLSWDIDKGWRKKAIRQLAPYQPTGNSRHRHRYRRLRHPLRRDAETCPSGGGRHQRGDDGDW